MTRTDIEFKSDTLAGIGTSPIADQRNVGVDLRDDWTAALLAHGFDPTAPTAWSAEGLLLYLPADAQDRLFDHVTAHSAPGSRLATEDYPDGRVGISQRFRTWGEVWEGLGLDVQLSDLIYVGDHNQVADYLEQRGWQVTSRTRSQIFEAYGRTLDHGQPIDDLSSSLNITAIRK